MTEFDKESREKDFFDEVQAKQAKTVKITSLAVFGAAGLIFAIVGGVLLAIGGYYEMGIVFLPFGLVLAVLGVIMYFAIPTKYNYGKYKERVKKYGGINIFAMQTKIEDLEKRIEELENNKN